jgi:hypothetical protein
MNWEIKKMMNKAKKSHVRAMLAYTLARPRIHNTKNITTKIQSILQTPQKEIICIFNKVKPG